MNKTKQEVIRGSDIDPDMIDNEIIAALLVDLGYSLIKTTTSIEWGRDPLVDVMYTLLSKNYRKKE